MPESKPIQCDECEVLLADNEQLARELRLTREGNPTFSDLRSQIETQAEQLTNANKLLDEVRGETWEHYHTAVEEGEKRRVAEIQLAELRGAAGEFLDAAINHSGVDGLERRKAGFAGLRATLARTTEGSK